MFGQLQQYKFAHKDNYYQIKFKFCQREQLFEMNAYQSQIDHGNLSKTITANFCLYYVNFHDTFSSYFGFTIISPSLESNYKEVGSNPHLFIAKRTNKHKES